MKTLRIGSILLCVASAGASELTVTPHWINSGVNNRDLTISPGNDELYSTVTSPANQFAAIITSRKVGGEWEAPGIASFSGTWSDIEPMFTPDGQRLWFSSTRPKPDRDGDDWDLWYVERNAEGWSAPINPGAPINSEENEFYPSIALSGNVYFTAEREIGEGSEDILRAVWEDGRYARIESIGPGVNSAEFEFNAFVAPDESYVIFSAQGGRTDAIGGGDLYISRRADDGAFGPAKLLPAGINSTLLDYSPFVHDGRFYFTSRRFEDVPPFPTYEALLDALSAAGNGLGDIYSASVDILPD